MSASAKDRKNICMALSDLSDLISLKGLITVSVGSLLAVKAIHVTWRVSKNNVSVEGTGNNVTVINQQLALFRNSFRLVWNLLMAIVLLSYPSHGDFYNGLLALVAYVGVPLAIAWFVTVLRGYGAERMWDFFYVLGMLIACWLILCAAPSLPRCAQYAAETKAILADVLRYELGPILRSDLRDQYLSAFNASMSTLLGFTLLLLSTGYLLFSFSAHRSFDGALRRTFACIASALVGYFLVCGVYINPSPSSIFSLGAAIFAPILN